MKIPEKIHELDRKEKILLLAAGIALSAASLRSYKIANEHLTFDVSVWGEKSKSVIADIIDDTKTITGRLAAGLILNNKGEPVGVIDLVEANEPPDDGLAALEEVLSDSEGWSGKISETPLQKG